MSLRRCLVLYLINLEVYILFFGIMNVCENLVYIFIILLLASKFNAIHITAKKSKTINVIPKISAKESTLTKSKTLVSKFLAAYAGELDVMCLFSVLFCRV